MITKDSVLKRKADLEAQRLEYVAHLNAVSGAIQDCDYWLNALNPDATNQVPELPPSS